MTTLPSFVNINKMSEFSVPRSELLSSAQLIELRREAKDRYYIQHICDLSINDVDLEDFVNDYVEAHYRAMAKAAVAPVASDPSTKTESKFRRLLRRISGAQLRPAPTI
ncbi:hypothetical protein CCHR01_04682 [Colletotrichum chrysophilum]|uniref:Uncharacterized protein n=2 Tax=Colletotrichum chrysophilum TaxID=1836956 RepID=A0AAD9EQA7_9PEZI|nr:hypothetical protein CCHR01_04682 [Colletotrichum chrysophilum]